MDEGFGYKLIHAIDPNKVDVPFNEKFGKLTLSSNKKKQKSKRAETQAQSTASRNLMQSFTIQAAGSMADVRPSRSSASTDLQMADTQLNTMSQNCTHCTAHEEESAFMDALQVTDDDHSIRSDDKQCEKISLNSTTDDGEEEDECITISDSTLSEDGNKEGRTSTEEFSVKISDVRQSGHTADDLLPSTLSNNKADRIEAFLRDVSFERRQIRSDSDNRDSLSTGYAVNKNTTILTNDDTTDMTRSMSSFIETIDPAKGIADDDTVLNTDTSDNEIQSNSSTPIKKSNEPLLEESVNIPETSSENESLETDPHTQTKYETKKSDDNSSGSSDSFESTCIAMSSINISAKVNINIQITDLQTTTSCSSSESTSNTVESDERRQSKSSEEVVEAAAASPARRRIQKQNSKSQTYQSNEIDNAPDDDADRADVEGFASHAEKLLNELYGRSWQTPEVIGTLKRTCRTTCKKPGNVAKKQLEFSSKKPIAAEESILADFSIFRQNIVNNNFDSTHLTTPIRQKGKCSPKAPNAVAVTEPRAQRMNKKYLDDKGTSKPRRQLVNKNAKKGHILSERWRQLIDDDSGSDGALASDEDLDASLNTSDFDSESDSSRSLSPPPTYKTDTKKTNKKKQELERNKEHSTSPPVNAGKNLDDILRTCRSENKPKIMPTPKPNQSTKPPTTKRKLFTPNFGYEDDAAADELIKNVREVGDELLEDLENVYLPGTPVHKRLQEIKKKAGITPKDGNNMPIFKTPTPTRRKSPPESATPNEKVINPDVISQLKEKMKNCQDMHYGFLKSLELSVAAKYCHPEALFYRENYRTKKEELSNKLYDMFNRDLFDNELVAPITWNKKLKSTAGRCLNKKRMGNRQSFIELSEKVLTSADRLRCTLIHEMCHAATWIFSGEGGHGRTWKTWAFKANQKFPDIPKIGVCHQYAIEYKYTYRCTVCRAQSHAHSKSKKVEEVRCKFCTGSIEVLLNKKNKEGDIISTPVKEATGFAKFVKDNYKQYKGPNLKHADVMKLLSNKFASLKVAERPISV